MAKTRHVILVIALLFVLWGVLAYQSSSVQATSPQGGGAAVPGVTAAGEEAAQILPETGAAAVTGRSEVLEGLAVLFVSMVGVMLVGFTVGFKTRPW